ncbi:hypothetical protein ACHAW5_008056 [Stephanodiscus triporus]|uniref:Uncharacterized protein n=1 Tax=Stephanodiscus triporus TaxID=2934178 RepID=A0ABD3Q1H4_9STRA
MNYVESMLETQLVNAIGKRLTPNDLDKFVKYHNARLLSPIPQPFSHAIRCPGHNPVGLLTIESDDGEIECIHTHSREVLKSSLKVPLSAATVLELTGNQYLHGYMNHRFGTTSKRHQLVARARQFSSFIMIVGNMTNASTLDPKDAVIVRNKDEVIISLLLDELPTAKEFKDAVKSLSPEQQRFARAYRKMQLSSSIFGVCIVQIKPQLEALLGLPADALDKEMKLTQDLMELFVEYQVPSDMLSYSGFLEHVTTQDKVFNVKDNVKSVLDVVNEGKEKQLKSEQAKTEMAMEGMLQGFAANHVVPLTGETPIFGAAASRIILGKASSPMHKVAASQEILIGSPMETRAKMAASQANLSARSYPYARCTAPPIHARSSISGDMLCSTFASDGMQSIHHNQEGRERSSSSSVPRSQSVLLPSARGVDFTLIPQILDEAIEKCAQSTALRSTTIKTGNWRRSRQENLLTNPKQMQLSKDDTKKERNKAFDLLDALSRSGCFPIAYSDLHVIVAVTHCFDKDVMSTVVCDNVNPIEKLECSTLILASAVHGVPARKLIGDANEVQRLAGLLPLLLQPAENNDVTNAAQEG